MEKEDLLLLQQKVSRLRAEGKYKETIEAGYQLLEHALKLNDHKSILTAHINNAASYYSIGDIEEALISIEAHEEHCKRYGDDADKLNSYNILFLLYEYNKDYIKAKATLEKSIQLGKQLKHFNLVSNGYSNYSHICNIEEDFAKALEMAEKGLEMAKLHKPASEILEFRVKLNIANSYIGLNRFENAKLLIDEMINDPILESFIREKTQCNDLLGRWYAKQGLNREAFDTLTNAKGLAESYNELYMLKTIQEKRMELCEKLNDVQLGYTVQKEYITLLNEISNKELALKTLKLTIKHNIASIEEKAYTDYLTGVYNRNYIEPITTEWLKHASTKNESIACIVFDLDNLKSINDEYGHLFGDEIIKQVSKAASAIIREDDLIGRFGGDEFVIILKGATLDDGEKKANELLKVISSIQIEKDGNIVSTTVSIGISHNDNGTIMNFIDLFHLADKGLYKAKQKGRNCVCIHNE